MPFYTYKCPSCDKEKEVLQKMNDKPPLCDGVKMKRIFKPNAKPGSKDGSWGFGKGGGG
jgi:putative FmdB family regulatory protein